MSFFCTLILLGILFSVPVTPADWPRFRGPNGSGVSEAVGLPVEFGPDKNVLWKTALPPGHSSPVLVGHRLFLTAYENDKLFTVCMNGDTGKVLWRGELIRSRFEHHHPNNSPATPSPVTDGQNVYAFFQDFGLVSYTVDGKERWRLPLGPFRSYKGMAASPIVSHGSLVLLCDQDVGSFLLAVNKDTGEIRWRRERPEIPGNGHSTPAVYEGKEGTQLIVLGAMQMAAYRLDTGKKLWWVTGFPNQPKTGPVVGKDGAGRATIYASVSGSEEGAGSKKAPYLELLSSLDKDKNGTITPEEMRSYVQGDFDGDGILSEKEYDLFMSGEVGLSALLAVRPEGFGDLAETNVFWRYRKGLPTVPSPLLYKGVLYLLKEGGIVTAMNPGTGEVLKQARLQGALDTYYASPVAADDKLYMVSHAGQVVVLEAGRDLKILAVNDLDEECFATPAITDGKLYVRTRSMLYCFSAGSGRN